MVSDRPTDRQTNIAIYRAAIAAKNSWYVFQAGYFVLLCFIRFQNLQAPLLLSQIRENLLTEIKPNTSIYLKFKSAIILALGIL